MRRQGGVVALVAAGAVAVSACSSMNVNELPQPGHTYDDGYDITLEFDNVLNLPDRAKVVLDGTTIGVVTKMAVTGQQVDVTSRIDPAVTVPSNIHAVLQQATVLGDIYVALERPQGIDATTQPMEPGGTIPLAQTTSPPQLEDTIANLANFVSSGSIQRVQTTLVNLNRVAPSGDGSVRRLSSRFAEDLGALSDNIDSVDMLLKGAADTAGVLNTRNPSYERWFSPGGMLAWDRGMTVGTYIGTLLPSVGSVYSGGYWLLPLLGSLANATGAAKEAKLDFEREVPAWRHLFTDFFLPQDKYPAINITSIVGPDGREMSGNVQDVLRMIGGTP